MFLFVSEDGCEAEAITLLLGRTNILERDSGGHGRTDRREILTELLWKIDQSVVCLTHSVPPHSIGRMIVDNLYEPLVAFALS